MNNILSLADSQIADLRKALESGYTEGVGIGGGHVFRAQSLDGVLHSVTYTAHHLKMWKKIDKSPARSTVEQYNVIESYGARRSPFLAEGQAPQENDGVFRRVDAKVKYVGEMAAVSHVMTAVDSAFGDVVTAQNQIRTLSLLGRIEENLFRGDSQLDSLQWDGLDALIDPTSVIDLGGAPLNEYTLEESSNIIQSSFGTATDLFCRNDVLADYSKQQNSRIRFTQPLGADFQGGVVEDGRHTQGGFIRYNASPLISATVYPLATATSSLAPVSPASIAAAAVAGTAGAHTKGAPAGTSYFAYLCVAVNSEGESAPTAFMGAAVAMTDPQKIAGNGVPLTITNPVAMGSFAPKYFRIFRSSASSVNAVPSDLSQYSLIAEVPAASVAASGTTTFTDNNVTLPHTTVAYVGEMTKEVLSFRQLLPLFKMDLAVVGPAHRWMILMYGVPVLFAPKKWVRIINIGRLLA